VLLSAHIADTKQTYVSLSLSLSLCVYVCVSEVWQQANARDEIAAVVH